MIGALTVAVFCRAAAHLPGQLRIPPIAVRIPAATSLGIQWEQTRGLKRGRKAPVSKAERLKRRALREAREAERKRYTFMERVRMHKVKGMASTSLQYPGRYDSTAENDLPQDTPCTVYFTKDVRTRFYTVEEALKLHRRLQSPTVFGLTNAPLKLRIELNMKIERSTKMVSDSRQLIALPFPFKHKEKRTILAFAGSKELQDQAMLAGADIALGPEMIKKILKGQFLIDDYDFCVAHEDMSSHIVSLRGVIKSRYPTKANGGIGPDLPAIVEKFLDGINLILRGDPVYPHWGICEPLVGKLDMPDEHIVANIGSVVTALCKLRNPALGPFINRACLMTMPGKAYYAIGVEQWEPVPSDKEIARVDKKQKKKREETRMTEVEKTPEELAEEKRKKVREDEKRGIKKFQYYNEYALRELM